MNGITEADAVTTHDLSIIGSGSLGTAILRGLLKNKSSKLQFRSIWAITSSESSASKLRESLASGSKSEASVLVVHGSNATVAAKCSIIILACPPSAARTVLGEAGMRDALKGKILISVLAGTTRADIYEYIRAKESTFDYAQYWVARALPNLAVEMGASSTAVEVSEPRLPAEQAALVDEIFTQLGGIVHVPASLMNACTVLCGSAPAFIALFADGLVDGSVVAGVPRSQANAIVAQMLESTAALMKNVGSPSALRESVCAMPGCTVKGNLELEQGGVRVAAAKAMTTAITAASSLG